MLKRLAAACALWALLPLPLAFSLVDIPTGNQRALDIAELASDSGLIRPVTTGELPLDDSAYLRAYEALKEKGLVDPLGQRIEAEVRARADGRLHLEYLVPTLDLRFYGLGGADERLLYHSSGDVLRDGFNSFLSASGEAFWGTHLGGAYELQLHQFPGDVEYGVKRLYLKGVLGKWSLTVGRDSERLGPGYHGSLLLSDNARPLDMVRIRTEEPVHLPGFLSSIGGFRFMIFDAYLSDGNPHPPDPRYASGAKVVKDPLLLGMRLTYQPADWFDFGISRTIMYSGAGRQRYDSPKDWWELLSATSENVKAGGSHRYDNDQYAGFDFTARLPFLNGLGSLKAGKVYWEYAFTDPPDPFVFKDKRVANLAGLYLSTGAADFRFEYAETGKNWYRHGIYGQGYSYRGLPLGHEMGGDARDFYFETSRYLTPTWRAAVSLDLQDRGLSLPVTEKRKELGWKLDAYRLEAFGVPFTGSLDFNLADVDNPLDDPAREDRTELFGGLELTVPTGTF